MATRTSSVHSDTMVTDASLPPNRLEAASRVISSACAWSAASGAIPIPFVDLFALGAVQVNMIKSISSIYGETLGGEAAKSLVAVLLGTVLPGGFAGAAAGAGAKLVPGFGTLFGMATTAGLGSAATYAIGKIFVRHFENGGNLGSFSVDVVAQDLQKEFAKAKPATV